MLLTTKLPLRPIIKSKANKIRNEGVTKSGYTEADEVRLMREIRRRIREFAEGEKVKKGSEVQKSIREMLGFGTCSQKAKT